MLDRMPETIGKYRITGELGRGATSCVYRAEDAFNQREVAIKVVRPPEMVEPSMAARYQRVFMNEAALAGRLNHPHIAAIYDAASEGALSYLVMEMVEGGTLEQFASPDRLMPVERLVEIVFKAAAALDYAHRHGVIHCDIKPANILITGDTDIKISDFGAAYFGAAQHTFLTGVGSPAYMAPEQVQERQVNHQTDIYALGAVMYQLLTGRLPFHGSSRASVMYQVVNIDPVPPSHLRPGLPEVMDRIVLKAMAKSRDDRYATWKDFSRDLADAFRDLGLRVEEVSDTEKFTALRGLSFFRDFRDVDVWEALRIARWHRVEGGSTLLKEGDEAGGFFVLTHGRIQISRAGRVLERGEAGSCFGEILYFEEASSRRTTTVTTTETCVAMELGARELRGASDGLQLQFNRAFIRILVNRLEQRESRLVAAQAAMSAV